MRPRRVARPMSYEISIPLKGATIEIEADTPAKLERRIAALDLRRLEEAIRKARGRAAPARRPTRARRAPPRAE